MPEGLPNLYVQLDTVKVRPKMREKAAAEGSVLLPVGKSPQQVEPTWHKVARFEDDENGERTIITGCGLSSQQDLKLDTGSPWQLTESATEPYTARCPASGCFGNKAKQRH